MKTALIVICVLGLTLSASAQKVVHVAPSYPRTHVSVGVGFGYGYGYGYPYGYYPYSPYWYNPWYAYPGYGYYYRPTKLDLEIQDITSDYKDKIWSARHDESLSNKQKKQAVHDLKVQRDNEILQAKKDYYKRK